MCFFFMWNLIKDWKKEKEKEFSWFCSLMSNWVKKCVFKIYTCWMSCRLVQHKSRPGSKIQIAGTCVLIGSYFSCRGSQSSPGRSCLAVCLTSSLSTNKLWRCSACTTATRIHSMRGGRSRNGLEEEMTFFIWLVLDLSFIQNMLTVG